MGIQYKYALTPILLFPIFHTTADQTKRQQQQQQTGQQQRDHRKQQQQTEQQQCVPCWYQILHNGCDRYSRNWRHDQ